MFTKRTAFVPYLAQQLRPCRKDVWGCAVRVSCWTRARILSGRFGPHRHRVRPARAFVSPFSTGAWHGHTRTGRPASDRVKTIDSNGGGGESTNACVDGWERERTRPNNNNNKDDDDDYDDDNGLWRERYEYTNRARVRTTTEHRTLGGRGSVHVCVFAGDIPLLVAPVRVCTRRRRYSSIYTV